MAKSRNVFIYDRGGTEPLSVADNVYNFAIMLLASMLYKFSWIHSHAC